MSPTGPNKAAGAKGWRGDSGFTLIEVMVVIVIIGLMSSFVLLNLPRSQQGAREQAEAFAARLALASRQAVLGGETVGVVIDREGYHFVRRRDARWEAAPLAKNTDQYHWEDASAISLKLEGETVALPRNSGKASAPMLFFTPTGDSLDFRFTLRADGEVAAVGTDVNGQIALLEAGGS